MNTKADDVVALLLNALEIIARAAVKADQQPYIQGCAEQAIKMAHAQMVRNSDGYLVVKS
jgi:hypothetical protein